MNLDFQGHRYWRVHSRPEFMKLYTYIYIHIDMIITINDVIDEVVTAGLDHYLWYLWHMEHMDEFGWDFYSILNLWRFVSRTI